MVKTDISLIYPFLDDNGPDFGLASQAHRQLSDDERSGVPGSGWLHLPRSVQANECKHILATAEKIRDMAQILVVIGIGGSYLGAKAAIEMLKPVDGVEILFSGSSLSADELNDAVARLSDKDFCINVISKSGGTLESAFAFRVFRELAEKKYGKQAKKRIFVTTDPSSGTLHQIAEDNGYEQFPVPSDTGGRYSVLSAVGLLPMACAGINIKAVLAQAAESLYQLDLRSPDNPSWQYAAARQALYHSGKSIELLAVFEPSCRYFGEWWKQLFGESEGKQGVGMFPATVEYNADLHSMGQYIQEGPRHMTETFLTFERPRQDAVLPLWIGDPDNLNALAGRSFDEFSKATLQAVRSAHYSGGVPCITLSVPARNEAGFADLVCFFEMSCAISGYMLGVNPFDQPGVEAYKKNLKKNLGLER